MKRAMWVMATVSLAAGLGACSPTPPDQAGAGADAVTGWTRPPVIERVERAGAELVFGGAAEPGARVVLRVDGGAAFASSADPRGLFEIRMGVPVGHLLLRPETQVGQDAAPSPDRLLILAGGRGPIAVLRAGGPTRRLDSAPALGAVDSDGRMRLASGKAAEGVGLVVVESDGETVQVAPGPDRRWSVMLGPQTGADQIRVGGRDYTWPGEVAAGVDLTVDRIVGGWRIGWTGAAGARQSTWLPDGA